MNDLIYKTQVFNGKLIGLVMRTFNIKYRFSKQWRYDHISEIINHRTLLTLFFCHITANYAAGLNLKTPNDKKAV